MSVRNRPKCGDRSCQEVVKLEQSSGCAEIAVDTPVIVQTNVRKRKVLAIESWIEAAMGMVGCSGCPCPDTRRRSNTNAVHRSLYGLGRAEGIVTVAIHPAPILQVLRYGGWVDPVQDVPSRAVLGGEAQLVIRRLAA